jgi:hypothetical protein
MVLLCVELPTKQNFWYNEKCLHTAIHKISLVMDDNKIGISQKLRMIKEKQGHTWETRFCMVQHISARSFVCQWYQHTEM